MKRTMSPEGQEKIRRAGLRLWKTKAKTTHNNRFDYTKVDCQFRTQKHPAVDVFCNKHNNWFSVTPFNHCRFKSGGCKSCDFEQSAIYFHNRERKKFSKWFGKNCADRLEVRSAFQGMTADMEFFCKLHKTSALRKPTHLMNNGGYGCDQCASESTGVASRLRVSKVRAELEDALPDHISIQSVVFDESIGQSSVRISCEHHGEQLVRMGTLKRSPYRCPQCGNEAIGYAGYKLKELVGSQSKGKPTYLGVMEVEVFGIKSLKVGVTTRTLEKRYKWYLKKILFSVQMPEVDAYILENQIHRSFRDKHDLRILLAGMRDGERWSGDTECYWLDRADRIIEFIRAFVDDVSEINYEKEVEIYVVPNLLPRDISRPKSTQNQPVAVVGVDPNSNEVIIKFPSIADARRAGYGNVSMVISDKYPRRLVKGLRWFREHSFDIKAIPPLATRDSGQRSVRCVETGDVYPSISNAGTELRALGVAISPSHISSVCKGKRQTAGGYRWEYA